MYLNEVASVCVRTYDEVCFRAVYVFVYDTCLFSIVFHRLYSDIHASDNKSEQAHEKSHCGLILCPSRNSEVQCCMNLPFVRQIFLASLCWRSFIDLPISLKYPKGV